MQRKKIKDFTFYFKNESIVIKYNDVFLNMHDYYSRDYKRRITAASRTIHASRKMDYDKIIKLSRQYNLKIDGATSASIKPLPPKRIIW